MESGLILVVDDEMSIRRALHTTLHNLGFQTVEAARGEAASPRTMLSRPSCSCVLTRIMSCWTSST